MSINTTFAIWKCWCFTALYNNDNTEQVKLHYFFYHSEKRLKFEFFWYSDALNDSNFNLYLLDIS